MLSNQTLQNIFNENVLQNETFNCYHVEEVHFKSQHNDNIHHNICCSYAVLLCFLCYNCIFNRLCFFFAALARYRKQLSISCLVRTSVLHSPSFLEQVWLVLQIFWKTDKNSHIKKFQTFNPAQVK